MSLIACTSDCIYQNDGMCSLQRVPTAIEKFDSTNPCMHYVKSENKKVNSKQSLLPHKES